MIFTSRTYRHAIRRSIQMERIKIGWVNETSAGHPAHDICREALHQQINHTRRLQARKRKERK